MQTIAPETTLIDVEHLGRRQVIAACLLESAGHRVLIDPGPASTLPTLLDKLAERDLAVADLEAVVLTHIHLDHAGATGSLVARNPGLRVYVQQRGARHLIDPTRLLESAGRLYGDDMDRLWGEFLPVPGGNISTLVGGERVHVGDRVLRVAYTPGHAPHHVCYHEPATGIAFAGDTAGVRIDGSPYVLPPTPPPDIDLPLWHQSLETLSTWAPSQLVLTHFGVVHDAADHLDALQRSLDRWGRWAHELLVEQETDEASVARFVQRVEAEVADQLDENTALALLQAASPEMCWLGLARYWRRRGL